jgi:hypothetical protein
MRRIAGQTPFVCRRDRAIFPLATPSIDQRGGSAASGAARHGRLARKRQLWRVHLWRVPIAVGGCVKVGHLLIENFRGIKRASLLLPDHAVLIGDNNTGKSTVLEALDLVLGPDRLSRVSPIDEHDFYHGEYLAEPSAEAAEAVAEGQEDNASGDEAPQIKITATVTGLSAEQMAHFGAHIEWWDTVKNALYDEADAAGLDKAPAIPALRVTFIGKYDPDEDDFEGKTYFTRSLTEVEEPESTQLPSPPKRTMTFIARARLTHC